MYLITFPIMLWSVQVRSEITPAELAEAHSQNVAAIHSIDCTVEVEIRRGTSSRDAGQYDLQSRIHWVRDGSKERIIGELPSHTKDRNGNLFGREDILREGDVLKVLLNWDWSKPPKIDPSNQLSSRGSVTAYQPSSGISLFDAPILLLLYPQVGVNDPRVPLTETLRRFSEVSIIPCKRTGPSGEPVVCLHLAKANGLKRLEPGDWVEVDIVPTLNFLVSGFVVTKASMAMPDPKTGKLVSCRYDMGTQVKQVLERDGVFIPVELVSFTYRHDIDDFFEYGKTTVKVRSANAPLAADAFVFRFPENLTVVDTTKSDQKGRPLLSVWGGDNRPAFETHDRLEIVKRYGGGRSGTSVSWLILVIAPAAILIFLWASRGRSLLRRK